MRQVDVHVLQRCQKTNPSPWQTGGSPQYHMIRRSSPLKAQKAWQNVVAIRGQSRHLRSGSGYRDQSLSNAIWSRSTVSMAAGNQSTGSTAAMMKGTKDRKLVNSTCCSCQRLANSLGKSKGCQRLAKSLGESTGGRARMGLGARALHGYNQVIQVTSAGNSCSSRCVQAQ